MHFTDLEIFDAHCDLPGRLYDGADPKDPGLHFSLVSAKKYARYIQSMAFCIIDKRREHPFSVTLQGIESLRMSFPDLPLITSKSSLLEHRQGTALLLAVEGGEAIEGSLDFLRVLFQKGVRLMTLTWNNINEIADAAAERKIPGGLTSFGREVVKEMERLGMAVDVSHISEKGFWDVLDVAEKPVIASHSCAMQLCTHPRNLTDSQFEALCKNGGIVGVNFYPVFLGDTTIDSILRHFCHFLSLGGENHIGFGSDFDGISQLPQGISGASDFDKIINALLRENISEEIVRKIAYKNLENYFLKVLPG
ncbi:MAG: dipeptidase [Clostridia bacterium]|nr:dipeptidase [Clostridia bacterium]